MPTSIKKTPRKITPIEAMPKYVNLAQRLLRHIAYKQLRPGDRLASEFELGSQYGVSRETVRQALLTLAEEGYVSREKGRGTFVRKSMEHMPPLDRERGIIALACSNEQVSHSDDDLAFAAVLRTIGRLLTDRGFTLKVLGLGENQDKDRSRLQELASRQDLGGVCAIGPYFHPYRYLFPDVPVITAGSVCPIGLPWVGVDTRLGCRVSVEYLLSHGHQNIALLCGAKMDHAAFSIFAEGYSAAFKSAGLPCPRHLMYHTAVGESLHELAIQILTGPQRPSAILAEGWEVCEQVLSASSHLNLRVPEDLSILAFGRNPLRMNYPVALTVYSPNYEQLAERAVDVICDMIEGVLTELPSIAIPGDLIERESVQRVAPSLLGSDKLM